MAKFTINDSELQGLANKVIIITGQLVTSALGYCVETDMTHKQVLLPALDSRPRNYFLNWAPKS